MADFDPDTAAGGTSASMAIRPPSKTMQEILTKIKGGESGGRYDIMYGGEKFDLDKGHPRKAVPITEGPNKGKTSSAAGAFQFIGSTWDAVAKKTGLTDMSKASQDINAARLAKDTYKEKTGRDIETDWATGDPKLRLGIQHALASEWESLGPGPRVSNLDSEGKPRFRFSDYAMGEHDGRDNTDLLMMEPQEYLDLTPEMKGRPFENPSGRSLMKSFNRGDAIEAVPTLDVNVDGSTATVTDQDGRHRALLAQQEGIEAIPVAVRKTGEGDPKEIVGMTGTKMAHDFPKAGAPRAPRQEPQQQQQQQREPISLVSSAQAAEPARDAAGNPVDAAPAANPYAQYAPPTAAAQPAQPAAAPQEDNPYAQYAPGGGDQQPAETTGGEKPSYMGQLGRAALGAAETAAIPLGLSGIGPAISALSGTDIPAGVARGLAPYAAGAGIGAAAGAPFGGVGAVPGAIAGAGAVGLTQLATGMMGAKTPQDLTDAGLTAAGLRPVQSPEGRVVEQAVGGAANAFTGAGAMQLLGRTIKSPLGKAVANFLAEHQSAQAVSGATGGAAGQGAAEAGAPPWMQQIASFVGALAPGWKQLAPNRWRINASPEAKAAVEAGFVIPPAEAEVGHIGTMNLSNAAAAEAGKIKSSQLASAKNQPIVNFKVQQELGVPEGTPLTPDVLRGVRNREGQVYRELAGSIPEVNLAADPQYRQAIGEISDRLDKLMDAFPHTKTTPEVGKQMENFRSDLMRNATGQTQTVMDYIFELRRQANHNLTRDNNAVSARLGMAQREAASQLEDAMERGVQDVPGYYRQKLGEARDYRDKVIEERVAQGLPLQGANAMADADGKVQMWSDRLAYANANNQENQSLIDRFRKARQTMAKSYDVEAVTNPSNGNVSATGLGRLLSNGRPLTGALKQIADAANNFHRAFQDPTRFGGVEPLSILDAAYAGGQLAAAVASHGMSGVGHAIAGMIPLTRPWTRAATLSPARQNAMIAAHQHPSALLAPFTTPFLPRQSTPGNALSGDNQ